MTDSSKRSMKRKRHERNLALRNAMAEFERQHNVTVEQVAAPQMTFIVKAKPISLEW